jgi:hypothetical protein
VAYFFVFTSVILGLLVDLDVFYFFTCSEVRELIATAGKSKCGTAYRQAIGMTGT